MFKSLSSRPSFKLLMAGALLTAAALIAAIPKSSASAAHPRVDDPCVADPGGPYTGTVGQSVQFDGSNSQDNFDGGGTNYHWAFGDGSGGNGMLITHTYSAAGTYTVTLQMSNVHFLGHCSGSTTATISN